MRRRGPGGAEDGQALVLLIGLVVLVLMVLALGWDTSNWFLGHRALANLADGAAVAAANDVDTRTLVPEWGAQRPGRAGAGAGDGGRVPGGVGRRLRGLRGATAVGAGGTRRGRAGVTVQVTAPARVGLLRLLRLVPPEMEGRAAATARLVPP
jgi:hypothetical protein